MRQRKDSKDHFVKFLGAGIVFRFSFLLTKLKEKWSEKLSIIWWLEENSILRGEKDGKIPWDLLYESMRWPLVRILWWLVNEPILWGFVMVDNGGESSIRFLKMWLVGSLKGRICDLLAIFCRWNFIGIISAMASMPSEGEVKNPNGGSSLHFVENFHMVGYWGLVVEP